MEPLGAVGLLLLGLLIVLLLWRASAGRPVTVTEALLGVVAFIAIAAPLPIQSRPEAATTELSATARDDFAASLAELRARLVALEETARALQRQIEAVAAAVSPRARETYEPGAARQPTGGAAAGGDTSPGMLPIRFAPSDEAADR